MTNPTPQNPQDLWQTILDIFNLAWRVPIAFLVIFACGCGVVIGAVFLWRLTSWVFKLFLAHPW